MISFSRALAPTLGLVLLVATPARADEVTVWRDGEAVSALQEYDGEAKLLAGGQSLVPMLNMRLARPGLVVDLRRVADLDYIAVSNMPGLLGSLLVGVTVAKALAWSLDKPLIGVNHVESHPYANILASGPWEFPVLHLVVCCSRAPGFH